MSTWQKGDKVGEYTLTEWIGKGAFGEVWKASLPCGKIERTYALKILITGQTDEDCFLAEARAWAAVSDPPHLNVNTIHFADSFREGRISHFVLASDYCRDGNLRSRLADAPLEREAALDIAEGILRGLAHLHAHQMVHRDLKPENILMRGSTPILADFGTARTVKDTIDISSFAGTIPYQSADILRKSTQNMPEDVWAAGMIVCELLGFHPFHHSLDEVMDRMPPTFPPDLPAALRGFLERAVTHNRSKGQRYQDGGEMLSRLLEARIQMRDAALLAERQQERTAADKAIATAKAEVATVTRRLREAEAREKAALKRADDALEALGVAQQNKDALAAEELKSLQLFQKAIEKNDASAMVSLGYKYSWGRDGLPQDKVKAVALYQKSADLGNVFAMHNLALMHANGQGGLPKDEAKAVALYQKAADLGNARAMSNLAFMYENGRGGLPKDEAKAVALYQKAADLGNARAISNLGVMYKNGQGGLPKDEAKAVALYQKAADLGDEDAMYKLGIMHENGRGGVPKDEAKAVALYQKSADLGDEDAMYSLAFMYENGRGGLPKDEAKAIELYRKAAGLNNQRAIDALKRLGK